MKRTRRPWVALALLTVALGGFTLGGSASAGGARAATSVVTGNFVGWVPGTLANGPGAFVAVIATAAKPGVATREVRVYVCDSLGINEWFPGRAPANANAFSLTSKGGARVSVKLTKDGATGTMTLGGRSFGFQAAPESGIAGLYTVTSLAGARLRGTSDRGGRFEGQITKRLLFRSHGMPHYLALLTITPPGGQPVTLATHWTIGGTGVGESRVIILRSGDMRGGKKTTSGFAIPCMPG